MQTPQENIFLLLGGNLGNVKQNFDKATSLIHDRIGNITSKSKLYQSEAWGFESDKKFLNQVLQLKSTLSPIETLIATQKIESELGRVRDPHAQGFQSRLIDIDILYFGSRIINTDKLVIPHYAIHERKFTLLPLSEIAPIYIHPVLSKSSSDLLRICPDQSTVTVYEH